MTYPDDWIQKYMDEEEEEEIEEKPKEFTHEETNKKIVKKETLAEPIQEEIKEKKSTIKTLGFIIAVLGIIILASAYYNNKVVERHNDLVRDYRELVDACPIEIRKSEDIFEPEMIGYDFSEITIKPTFKEIMEA